MALENSSGFAKLASQTHDEIKRQQDAVWEARIQLFVAFVVFKAQELLVRYPSLVLEHAGDPKELQRLGTRDMFLKARYVLDWHSLSDIFGLMGSDACSHIPNTGLVDFERSIKKWGDRLDEVIARANAQMPSELPALVFVPPRDEHDTDHISIKFS